MDVFILDCWIYAKVKFLHIHTHVSASFFGYDAVPIFIIFMSAIGMMKSPGCLTKFPPTVMHTQYVSVLCGIMPHTACDYVAFNTTGISNQYVFNIVLQPACSLKSFKSCPILLHIPFFSPFYCFPLHQISVFDFLSSCITGETVWDGVNFNSIFFLIFFKKRIFLECIGAVWLFIFVPVSIRIVWTWSALILFYFMVYLWLSDGI